MVCCACAQFEYEDEDDTTPIPARPSPPPSSSSVSVKAQDSSQDTASPGMPPLPESLTSTWRISEEEFRALSAEMTNTGGITLWYLTDHDQGFFKKTFHTWQASARRVMFENKWRETM